MTDERENPQSSGPEAQDTAGSVPWTTKASAVLFCIFCLELGAFLIIFPWLEIYPTNWFVQFRPEYTTLLTSYSFRGAMTGLGCLNVIVGVVEVFRLKRFHSPATPRSGGERPPAS
ncbi:MAG: hypothetical protein HXY18_03905 [Bryobacteraceae bacterium]|nr:hypothetical protein [Bryobacteraceae bacterium]